MLWLPAYAARDRSAADPQRTEDRDASRTARSQRWCAREVSKARVGRLRAPGDPWPTPADTNASPQPAPSRNTSTAANLHKWAGGGPARDRSRCATALRLRG